MNSNNNEIIMELHLAIDGLLTTIQEQVAADIEREDKRCSHELLQELMLEQSCIM